MINFLVVHNNNNLKVTIFNNVFVTKILELGKEVVFVADYNVTGEAATAAVAAMTETSHEGADFVAGATVSSKEILALAAEACTQYASDKAVALLGYTAAYEVTTLAELPADSAILNTYVGKVDGVAKVIGYEVKVEFSFDTGHGDAVINGSFFITISLEDNKVVNSVLFNGGSMKNYTEKWKLLNQ